MATPNRPASQNKYSEQYMQNSSFDEDFGENTVEVMGYDSINNVLRRLLLDTNGLIPNTTNSGTVYVNGTAYSVKRAFANVAASTTDSSIISAVASKKLRILSVVLECGATATNITFNTKPAGAGTAISMQFQNGANSGAVLARNEDGWFETNSGEGLTVTTGAGSTTGVQVNYIEV